MIQIFFRGPDTLVRPLISAGQECPAYGVQCPAYGVQCRAYGVQCPAYGLPNGNAKTEELAP